MHRVIHTNTKHHHNLTTLDVAYNPDKHYLIRTKQLFQRKKHQIQTKFEMQRWEFWERQFTVFPVNFTVTYR